MAATLEKVVKQLEDSGVVAAGKLENFIPPKASPKDAEELVRELIKQNVLTRFQAQQVVAGKAKALILGNYTILDKIGAGGMGQVFKAEHRRMHRAVAIKMLPSAMVKDPAALARFEREVTAAAKLTHPNIVAAYDADEANGVHFLVMEYVEGQDLSATVKKHGPLPLSKAVDYIRQTACGLAFAHGEGVVHRDIKPANLLVDKKGTVKILDMGLARIDQPGGETSELTGTGAVMGTVDYMAPEQALNTKHADQRADIYSLGITLHYLLAGKAAYGGDTVMEKLLAHREQAIPSLKELDPTATDALDGVFKKMVAKKIDDRYQTMSEVAAALEQCTAGLSSPSVATTGNWQAMPTMDASELSIALGHQNLRSIDAPTEFRVETVRVSSRQKAVGRDKGPPWKNTKVLIGAGAAGFFALLLGVIVIIRGHGGEEIARIEAPAGASVEVQADTSRDRKGAASVPLPRGRGSPDLTRDHAVAPHELDHPDWIELTDPSRWVQKTAGSWELGSAVVNPSKGFNYRNGGNELVRIKRGDIYTRESWGDVQVELEFLMPKGSNSGVFLMGEYEINVFDGTESGNIHNGAKPVVQAVKPAGEWQSLSIDFRAPRFDGEKKIADARFVKVVYNGQVIHENAELRGVTKDGSCLTGKESPTGPLLLQGALGAISYRNIRVRPMSGDARPLATWQTPAFEAWLKAKQALPAEQQLAAVSKKLMELNPGFDGTLAGWNTSLPRVVKGIVTEIGINVDGVSDISPLRAFAQLTGLTLRGSGPGKSSLFDLSPLEGMQLTHFTCNYTTITDPSPLADMPLTYLNFSIPDLSIVRGKSLKTLYAGNPLVSDVSPLRGMPVEALYLWNTSVADLSPLEECRSLRTLNVTNTKVTGAGVAALQAKLPDCKITWDGNKEPGGGSQDSARAWQTPAFEAWIKATQALSAEQQLAAVSKKLMELNPGFDGKFTGAKGTLQPKIENGKVAELRIVTDKVTDISPVVALPGLKRLDCSGSGATMYNGVLTDLEPLRGVALESLAINDTRVADLSPLSGMPLARLSCFHTKVSDLGPLKGMPLANLSFHGSPVSDVTPLAGLPLTAIAATHTRFVDVSPLAQCPQLKSLLINSTPVTAESVAALRKALPHCKIECDASKADSGKPRAGDQQATFTSLFNGRDLSGWRIIGAKDWKVLGRELVCSGSSRTYLYSQRNDYRDFHLRVEAKINEQGNSGVYFRCTPGEPGKHPAGYEAQISASQPDQRTGSLYNIVKISKQTAPADTWFAMEVIAVGPRIRILVDGKEVVDYTDLKAQWSQGAIGLQQNPSNNASAVHFRKIEIRELRPDDAR